MARVTIDDGILTDIADSIREKTSTEDSIAPTDMAEMIMAISGGSENESVERVTIQVAGSVSEVEIPTDILLDDIDVIYFAKTSYYTPSNSTPHYVLGYVNKDGIDINSSTKDHFVGITTNWGGSNPTARMSSETILKQDDGLIIKPTNNNYYFAQGEYNFTIVRKD